MDRIILPQPNAEQRQQIIEGAFKDFTAWLQQNKLPIPNYQELRILYFNLAFAQFQNIQRNQQNMMIEMMTKHEKEFMEFMKTKVEGAKKENPDGKQLELGLAGGK